MRPLEEVPLYQRRSPVRPPWWRPSVPWTMYRYFIVEILRVFVLSNLAVSLLYTTLVAYQTVRSGLRVSLIWPLIAKTFAYPLYYSVPISFLFALTLVISRMAGDLEITALKTHGVSYRQLYAPVMAIAIVLAGFSIYLNGWIVPHVRYEKRNIHRYILMQLEDLGSGENRRIRLPGNKGTLFVKAYKGTDLRQVHITLNTSQPSSLAPALREHLPRGLPSQISVFAREGDLEIRPDLNTVFLSLRGVDVLVPESVGKAKVVGEKFHQRVAISDTVVIPLRFERKRQGTKDRTNPELLAYIDELRLAAVDEAERERQAAAKASRVPEGIVPASFKDGEKKKKRRTSSWQRLQGARTEWYRRLAFSLSCLTFPLVGVALALSRHRGNRLVPFFLGNAVVIAVFYPLLMVGVSLGERGWPMISLALPNIALIGLGVFLTRRVIRQ